MYKYARAYLQAYSPLFAVSCAAKAQFKQLTHLT